MLNATATTTATANYSLYHCSYHNNTKTMPSTTSTTATTDTINIATATAATATAMPMLPLPSKVAVVVAAIVVAVKVVVVIVVCQWPLWLKTCPGTVTNPGVASCRAGNSPVAMASSSMPVQKATIDLSSFSDAEELAQVMGLFTEKSAWKGHRSWAQLDKPSMVLFYAPCEESWVVCDRRNLQHAFVWSIVDQAPGRYDLPPTSGWVGFGSSEFIECDISMVEPEVKTEAVHDARPGVQDQHATPGLKRLRLNKDGLPANAVRPAEPAAPVPVEAGPSQPVVLSPQPPLGPPPARLLLPTPPPPPPPAAAGTVDAPAAGTVDAFVEHVKTSKRHRGGWYEKAQAICQAVNTGEATGDFTSAVQLCKMWGFKDCNNQAPTKAAALGILQETLSQVMASTAAAVADEAAAMASGASGEA